MTRTPKPACELTAGERCDLIALVRQNKPLPDVIGLAAPAATFIEYQEAAP